MIEDAQHLAALDAMQRELLDTLTKHNRAAEGITDKMELLDLRLKQNLDLVEILRQHRRGIDYHAGRPIAPEVHYAEATLTGVGFGGVS